MGFFSAIGSAFSSAVSFVGSTLSSIGSGLSSALRLTGAVVTGIGKALGGAVKSLSSFVGGALTAAGRLLGTQALAFVGAAIKILSGPLGPILGPMLLNLVIQAVIKVVNVIAKKLGLIEEEDKPEEIGYRLEEADQHPEWKKQEDFPSWKEYYQYLKEQIPEVDTETIKSKELHYQLLGMAAERQAIEKELSVELPETFLYEAGRSKMTAEEILAFTDVIKIFHWAPVQDYLKDKLPAKEVDRIEDALISALMKRVDGKTEQDLLIRLNAIRNASADDRKLVDVYRDELEKNYAAPLEEAAAANELPKFYQKGEK